VAVAANPESFGQRRLVLEEQAILTAPGVQVQVSAQAAQEGLAGFEQLLLLVGDETALFEILPAPAVACRLGNPEDQLQVAQSPGPFLAVRFEAVRGVAEALMAVLLLHALGLEEGGCVETGLEDRRKP
jgi:hypothetical protein